MALYGLCDRCGAFAPVGVHPPAGLWLCRRCGVGVGRVEAGAWWWWLLLGLLALACAVLGWVGS